MWLCLLLKLGLPEQAVGWFPLRFGLVVEDKPTEFSCTAYMLGTCTCIINQVRNVGTSVTCIYLNISLIRYNSDQPMDKGVWIIEVALYKSVYQETRIYIVTLYTVWRVITLRAG